MNNVKKRILFSKRPIPAPLYSDSEFWQHHMEMEALLEKYQDEDPTFRVVIDHLVKGKRKRLLLKPLRFRSSKNGLTC